jgi:hypothetical protein
MIHALAVLTVAIAVLVLGFVVGMCVLAKRADQAMSEALKKERPDHFAKWMEEWAGQTTKENK